MKRAKSILLWIIGIMFIITGTLKLAHYDPMSEKLFGIAAYPTWLFYVVGLFELGGGALLLMKKTRLYGAAMIIVVMIGALFTHMMLKDSFVHDIVPTLIIVFLGSMTVANRNKDEFVPASHGKL